MAEYRHIASGTLVRVADGKTLPAGTYEPVAAKPAPRKRAAKPKPRPKEQ